MPMPDNPLIAALLQENKNVLAMDVCSLLDALRTPVRGSRGAVEMVTRMDREIRAGVLLFVLVLPSLFAHEWKSNFENVRKESTQSLELHKGQSDYFKFLHQALYSVSLPIPDVTQYKFEDELEQACLRVRTAAQTIEESDTAKLLAFDRFKAERAPSSRNKPEIKDCVIFEEVLAMGWELRGAGFAGKIVFVSSNTSDYGKTGQPFPEIAADLQAVQAEFASTLNYAYHLAAQE